MAKVGQSPTKISKITSKTPKKNNSRTLAVVIDGNWIRAGTFPVSEIDQRAVKLLQLTEYPVVILNGDELDTLFEPSDGGVMMTDKRGRKAKFTFEQIYDTGNDD